MSKITGEASWLPFQLLIGRNELDKCVDYSKVDVPLPFHLSMVTGCYQRVNFTFTDHTLMALTSDLNIWVSNSDNWQLDHAQNNKIKFVVDIKSLEQVTMETLKAVI